MFISRNIIASASRFGKNCLAISHMLSSPVFGRLTPGIVHCERRPCSSETDKHAVPGPMSSKFEMFEEKTAPIILDVAEERLKIVPEEEIRDEFEEVKLERGVSGVFDLRELVDLLKNEKAKDVCVIKVSEEYRYADYLIIVTGISPRHMVAMLEFVRKVFKMKMHKSDNLPMVEGKASTKWMALDLGNIIVHVFSKGERELYDLESLWALGKEYDSLSQSNSTSSYDMAVNYTQILSKLTPQVSNRVQVPI